MKKFLYVILMLLIPISLFAAATNEGTTGLITVPTAESLIYRQVEFAVDYQLSAGNTSSGNISQDNWYYKLNLGTFKNWELGIVGGTVPTEGVYFNAKYYLMSDNSRYPLSLAIGLDKLSSAQATAFYLVATQKFQGGFTGTIGFNYKFTPQEPAILLGGEYYLNNQFSILGDLSNANKEYIFNLGCRYYLNSDLLVRFSAINLAQTNSYYSFGFSYNKFM